VLDNGSGVVHDWHLHYSFLVGQSPFPCLFLEVCSTRPALILRSHQFSLSRHSAIDVVGLSELRTTRRRDVVGLCPATFTLFRWDAFGHASRSPSTEIYPIGGIRSITPHITPRAQKMPPFTANHPIGGRIGPRVMVLVYK